MRCATAMGFVDDRVIVSMFMVMTEVGVSHCHELDEEEDKDGHQGYALSPVVLGDRSGKAFARQGIGGRSKEVNECGGNNDSRAKVLCCKEASLDELAVDRPSSGPDGKHSAEQRANEDDEDGRDSDAHVAVVVVSIVTMARCPGKWDYDGCIVTSCSSNRYLPR